MRLSDLKENDKQLDEILPVIGAVGGAVARAAVPAIARGAAALGSAALRGGAALARGAGSAISQGAKAIGQGVTQAASGLAGGGMDPAQAAMAAKERNDQKKQIQDAIKQKQQELADLQKELTALG